MSEHRYSRQSYTIGKDLMTKLSSSRVLVIGYNILGQELIKNLSLLGIKSIDIYNNITKLTRYQYTGLYYDYDNNIWLDEMCKLNPTVTINLINNYENISIYHFIILINGSIDDGIYFNNLANQYNIPFTMTGCYGLMGYIFNDFGDNFVINDIDGEEYEKLIILDIEDKIIKFKDNHNLSNNDILIIEYHNDISVEFIVKNVKTPLIVEMFDNLIPNLSIYKSIIKKKIPVIENFKRLENNLNNIDVIITDYSLSTDRSYYLHQLHLAYDKYRKDFNEPPRAWSPVDFEVYKSYINYENMEEQIQLAQKFCYTSNGNLLPFVSIIGASVAQEILKGLGHKYVPIKQWSYIDYLELIDDVEISNYTDLTNLNYRTNSKYEGIVNIFGKELYNKITNTIPFVIGAGAIGCELIKNLGMMGVKQIILTDMDNIEKSNLSRQFLFSDNDIKKSKSNTARDKIKIMNSDINVTSYELKVCSETENIFDNKFHNNVDIYLNALDNIDARLYVDNLSIKYSKPLIDSGTMGSRGSVQVVVPNVTESYGSTKDQDTSEIPICTIKSFPYKPAHTIQWSRELFELEFNLIPNLINKYRDELNLLKLTENELEQLFNQIYKYNNFNNDYESFYNISMCIYYENYIKSINELLEKYDNIEKDPSKNMPIKLSNILEQSFIHNYLKYGFILLSQLFNLDINFSNKDLIVDFNYKIYEDSIDNFITLDKNNKILLIKNILSSLSNIKSIEFEKDDDELMHVVWITECANIRNYQYSIQYTDVYETRKIAGNIIPAMITTTALIAGYQILEFIKIVKYHLKNENNISKIDYYKNRFVNLNINYCDGITPYKCEQINVNNNIISLWTCIIINTCKVDEIINHIETKFNKKIEFITQGNLTIFNGDDIFINSIENYDENLLILIENIDIPINIKISM